MKPIYKTSTYIMRIANAYIAVKQVTRPTNANTIQKKITIEQNNLRKHQPRNPQKNQTNSSTPKEKRTLKRKETDEDPLKSQNRRITQTDTPTKPQNNPNTARYLF